MFNRQSATAIFVVTCMHLGSEFFTHSHLTRILFSNKFYLERLVLSSVRWALCVCWDLTFYSLRYLVYIFMHLKLCFATATHNFKWLKNYLYFFISDQSDIQVSKKENASSSFTVKIQYCQEPTWPRGSVLGLRPPGHEFRILCLEDSIIAFISQSSLGSPGPV